MAVVQPDYSVTGVDGHSTPLNIDHMRYQTTYQANQLNFDFFSQSNEHKIQGTLHACVPQTAEPEDEL